MAFTTSNCAASTIWSFDAKGGVYFTEPYGSSAIKPDGRVFYLPPGKDARLQLVSDGLSFPNGIVITNDGENLLVGEFALKRITSLVAPESTNPFEFPLVVVTTEGGYGPDGMLMRPDGILHRGEFPRRRSAGLGCGAPADGQHPPAAGSGPRYHQCRHPCRMAVHHRRRQGRDLAGSTYEVATADHAVSMG